MSFTDDVQNNDAQSEYDKKLQEELDKYAAYRKSLEEEFAKLDADDPATHKIVRDKIHELVPTACETIALLLEHSESDSVRANLAKYIVSEASKTVEKGKQTDYVEELFKKLAANDNDDVEAEVEIDG